MCQMCLNLRAEASGQILPEVRVTRLGEFLPIGWLLSLSYNLIITEVAESLDLHTFFPRNLLCINFYEWWFGLQLGWLFRKLIWSPCPKSTLHICCCTCQKKIIRPKMTAWNVVYILLRVEVGQAWFFWAWVRLRLHTLGSGFFRLEKITK
jgi:hypothetical protein